MTPLRQRMIDAMVLRGFATRTHKTYLSAVALMARHHHCSPALLSDEQVQAYLLYLLQERQRPRSTVDITSCAVRFLVCDVLGQDQRWAQTPMGPAPLRLPEGLSRADDRPVQATCVRSAMALHFSRCGHRPGGWKHKSGRTSVATKAWLPKWPPGAIRPLPLLTTVRAYCGYARPRMLLAKLSIPTSPMAPPP